MTYFTTLIIPFRFDCGAGGISDVDANIQKQGVWQRANYSDPNAVPTIAALYNTSGAAAMYTANSGTVNDLFHSREFRVVSRQEKYNYSYDKLTLFVFTTGVGFLCTELSVREAAALRRLRNVVANGVTHEIKTGKDTYKAFPMIDIVTALLNFCENQPFFTSPNPQSFAQANLLVYAFNDTDRSNEAVPDDIFGSVGEYVAKRLNPFAGVSWGISSRLTVLVSNAECRIVSTQLQSNVTLHYLPLIVLALHRKAAAFRYAEAIRTRSGKSDRLREEITTFQNTFQPENVSDAAIKQQIYNEVVRLNPAELTPLTTFLADEEKRSSAKNKKISGVINILIAAVGLITSNLFDALSLIQEFVPESMRQFARYGLYGLCVALAALGIYGVYLIIKPSK